jgi:hypothetical protein
MVRFHTPTVSGPDTPGFLLLLYVNQIAVTISYTGNSELRKLLLLSLLMFSVEFNTIICNTTMTFGTRYIPEIL